MLDGMERWEYAWVPPQEMAEHSDDRWHLPYASCWSESIFLWHDGKLLMERNRLADDDELRRIAG